MSGRYSTEVFAEPWWLILGDKRVHFHSTQLDTLSMANHPQISMQHRAAMLTGYLWRCSSYPPRNQLWSILGLKVASMILLHISDPEESWNWAVIFLFTTSQKKLQVATFLCPIHLETLASSSLVIWQSQVFLTLFPMDNASEVLLF